MKLILLKYNTLLIIITIIIIKLIEERKNITYIDLKFRKQLKKVALLGKIPDNQRKDVIYYS